MPFTLSWIQEESMLMELLEYFADMLSVLFWVLRVNEDVVKVDNHECVEEVGEDIIHEMLECCYICEPEGHHTPFKGFIAGVEGSLPFIPLSYEDQVICMAEIEFCFCLGHPTDLSLKVMGSNLSC